MSDNYSELLTDLVRKIAAEEPIQPESGAPWDLQEEWARQHNRWEKEHYTITRMLGNYLVRRHLKGTSK